MFCSFFPPKALFQEHSRFVIFSSLFFFFCLPFRHSMFFSSTPFEIIFSFGFFGSIFVAPFLSSFLLLSFQPVSCHPLLQSTFLAFTFGRFALLVFLFAWYCFQAWHFFFIFLVGFCLVFFWLLLSSFFHHWEFYFLFIFLLFFVKQMWRRLFWFQISDIGKRCFPCGSGGYLGKWLISDLDPGVLLVLALGSWVLKNQAWNNGTRLALNYG